MAEPHGAGLPAGLRARAGTAPAGVAPAVALLFREPGCLFSSFCSLASWRRRTYPLAAGSCSSPCPWQEQPAHKDLAVMIWGRSEFSGPQQPHEQLLRVRLGTVGSCASNQMGSSKPKNPGEQTRAMGSGWQMRQLHHGQPPAPPRPPPHWPSSSGSPGPEAGEAWAWAPHTCEVQGRAPPRIAAAAARPLTSLWEG